MLQQQQRGPLQPIAAMPKNGRTYRATVTLPDGRILRHEEWLQDKEVTKLTVGWPLGAKVTVEAVRPAVRPKHCG